MGCILLLILNRLHNIFYILPIH